MYLGLIGPRVIVRGFVLEWHRMVHVRNFHYSAGRTNSPITSREDLAYARGLVEERLGVLTDTSMLVFPLWFPNSIVQMQKQSHW